MDDQAASRPDVSRSAPSTQYRPLSRPALWLGAILLAADVASRAMSWPGAELNGYIGLSLLEGQIAALTLIVILSTAARPARYALLVAQPILVRVATGTGPARLDEWSTLVLSLVAAAAPAVVGRGRGLRIMPAPFGMATAAGVSTLRRLQISLGGLMFALTILAALIALGRRFFFYPDLFSNVIGLLLLMNFPTAAFAGLWAVFGRGYHSWRIAVVGASYVIPLCIDYCNADLSHKFPSLGPPTFFFAAGQLGLTVGVIATLGLARILGFRAHWIASTSQNGSSP